MLATVMLYAYAYSAPTIQPKYDTDAPTAHTPLHDTTQIILYMYAQKNRTLPLMLKASLISALDTLYTTPTPAVTPIASTSTPLPEAAISDLPTYTMQPSLTPPPITPMLQVIEETAPLQWPVQGVISVRYGESIMGRDNPSDYILLSTEDTTIHAITHGTVIYAQRLPDLGLTVIIDHGKALHSIYSYSDALLVQTGQKVRIGDPIASFLNNGTKKSLYFALRKNNTSIDPMSILPS